MKRSSMAILFGVVFLLVGIEVLLIYIACTTQTEEDVTFEDSKSFTDSTTDSPHCDEVALNLKLPTPLEKTTTTDRITTVSSIQLSTTSTQSTTDPRNLPSVPTVSSFSPPIVTNPTMATFECELNVTENPSMCITRPTTPTLSSHSSIAQVSTVKTNATSTNVIVKTTEARKKESTEYFVDIPKFNYVLRNDKGVACVMANMAIQINLQVTATDPQITEKLTVPADIKPEGTCAEETINMTLSWEESTSNQTSNKKNKITFNYAHDNSKFFLDTIFVQLNEKIMTENTTGRSLQLFSAKIKDGIFMCEVNTVINIGDRMNVVISDIYLIVFNDCFGNCTKTGTNCIIETAIRTIAIIGTIIVAIVLVLIIFVIYLLWYMERKLVLNDSKEFEAGTTF